MKLSIGVIFGGRSLEHDLSVLTAIQAMDNIDKERYEVVQIDHVLNFFLQIFLY